MSAMSGPRVLAALDKFRGTVSAAEAAAAVALGVQRAGGTCIERPVADGGEGTLDALGGANRRTIVMGPLGDPVEAGWRLAGKTAVIEMARASGLALVGGGENNDPIAASTHGTGELLAAAVDAGARRIIVGVGGSATTDGGLGALRAMQPLPRFSPVDLIVACDVRTLFVDAANVFSPQKGATPAQVKLLRGRLERLAQVYIEQHRIDVREIPSSGAAGGLAGGLAAIGARLVPGFELVADELDLAALMTDIDLVVTGEGFLDEQSFEGKVVGGVQTLAREAGVPVLAIAGQIYDGCDERIDAISLTARYGEDRSRHDTAACIADAIAEHLAR
jgi:glycerate 2-kinase